MNNWKKWLLLIPPYNYQNMNNKRGYYLPTHLYRFFKSKHSKVSVHLPLKCILYAFKSWLNFCVCIVFDVQCVNRNNLCKTVSLDAVLQYQSTGHFEPKFNPLQSVKNTSLGYIHYKWNKITPTYEYINHVNCVGWNSVFRRS